MPWLLEEGNNLEYYSHNIIIHMLTLTTLITLDNPDHVIFILMITLISLITLGVCGLIMIGNTTPLERKNGTGSSARYLSDSFGLVY